MFVFMLRSTIRSNRRIWSSIERWYRLRWYTLFVSKSTSTKMVSPFDGFDDLEGIWAQAFPVLGCTMEIVVDVRLPGDTFSRLKEHFGKDQALVAFSRMMSIACSCLGTQVEALVSQRDIDKACCLSMAQIQGVLDADTDCDGVLVYLFDKRVVCFKRGEDANDRPVHSTDAEIAMADLVMRANRAIAGAKDVLGKDERVSVAG